MNAGVPNQLARKKTKEIAEAIAFAPDGKTLVTASWDASLRFWDTPTGKVVRDLVGHSAPVQSAAISPDGKTLASGDAAGKVMFFKCGTGERLAVLKAHSQRCFGLAFSPNGKQLETAGCDRVVKIWDLETRSRSQLFALFDMD